tara:strand:+ start:92 stop:628 length:537 start_codon:yes stop_codon:yes gene_type:complete
MWLDKIESFQKDNSQILDMKHELHIAIYIKGLLKDSIEFSLSEGSLLIKLLEENKELSFDEFYYWWNIHRFDEVITEEELIFNDFNELKNKILPAIDTIKQPEIKDSDSEEERQKKEKKIASNNEKAIKLQNHVKSEADKSNAQINILKQFRSIYPTKDSLHRFIENVTVLLNHENKI